MMKKMKGVASIESKSPYADPKIGFKHHSLIQDFDELQKETRAMRERLERVKRKKLTLMAEVGFLRRRYKHLMKNQHFEKPPCEKGLLLPQFAEPQRKKIGKGNNYGGKGTFLRQQTPVIDFDHREKVPFLSNGKRAALRPPVPVFDSNQKGRAHFRKEATVRNSAPVLDLNETERFNGEKETPLQNVAPAFDLNQVSMEEEELQANYEPLSTEEFRNRSISGGGDEQLKDMKLSVCRNTGNGSSRARKRKISWQDQVALRV